MAIDGRFAIVGIPTDNPEPHESAWGDGAAYVFDVVTGEQLYRLTASDAPDVWGLRSGSEVVIDGNLAAINGTTPAAGPGAAYVFDLTTGKELYSIRPADGHPIDYFGDSLALQNKTLVVGAGGYNNSGLPHSGAAYVYRLVPEPSSSVLVMLALGAISFRRR